MDEVNKRTIPLNLWAKNGVTTHLLEYHSIDVASVCREYLHNDSRVTHLLSDMLNVDKGEIIDLLCFLCSIHDLGKTCTLFQNQNIEQRGYYHDIGGYQLGTFGKKNPIFSKLCGVLHISGMDLEQKIVVRSIFRSAFMHHGSPAKCDNYKDKYSIWFNEVDVQNACAFIEHMIGIYGHIQFSGLCSQNIKRSTNLFAGVITLCDWIASEMFEYCSEQMPLEEYKEKSEKYATYIFSANILNIAKTKTKECIFKDIFGFDPSPLQKLIQNITDGTPYMCIIEDATGAGKTEAALFLALETLSDSDLDGITFALPTRATSNLMFNRISRYSDSMLSDAPSISLQHGSSRSFLEAIGIDLGKNWTDGKNKAMFANISVCTIDQILASVIFARFQPLKLLSISRHVVIVDEVHAYDPYTFNILCRFIEYCNIYGIPIILLSATIPTDMKKKMIESYGIDDIGLIDNYPLITYCSKRVYQIPCETSKRSARTMRLRYVSDETAIISEMTSLASKGNRVCWIRNTVDDAISAYDSIPDGDYRKILIHSRFIQADRQRIESEIINICGKGSSKTSLIVISTQVIEQSLDIEFERIFSDLAPIDSLIQRMGRNQRFGSSTIPCEFIINGPAIVENPSESWYSDYFEKSSFVYQDLNVLYKTACLMSKDMIEIPTDYRKLIECAYDHDDEIPAFHDNRNIVERRIEESIESSNYFLLNPDKCYGCDMPPVYASFDNQWDAQEWARTRENDERTCQCMLIRKDCNSNYVPLADDPEKSIITLKKRYVNPDLCRDYYDFGKWKYITKVPLKNRIEDDGEEIWFSDSYVTYSKEKGAQYVQSDK